MKYKCEYKDEFIVPVFTQESGYWEKIMKPRLQQQRWYIAEVDCVGVEDIVDFGRRLLRALNFSVGDNEYISPIWYENLVGEISGVSMRQGFFIYYKNFGDFLSMHHDADPESSAVYAIKLLENMSYHYSDLRGYIYEQYPVVVGYGVGLPSSYIPQFEDVMGAENVMIAGEGVRYPWSDFEEEQRRNFPNGAPDPLYDKYGELFGVTTHSSQTTGVYVDDPRYYSESPLYDPALASKVHLVHSEFDDPE